MLKEKWKKLLLREKVLLISGIFVILSIPLLLITSYSITISMIFFIISVFYNLYKFIQMTNLSLSEAVEIDFQKGKEELKEKRKGKKVSGVVRVIALPFAFCIGIPTVIILLIYLWIITI